MKRVPWNLEEAVILHDAYMRVVQGKITRSDAIGEVSVKLRALAEASGIEIDDKFRNKNGIGIQLSIMEFVLTNGQRGLGHPPKIFIKAAELYNTDMRAYENILKRSNIVNNDTCLSRNCIDLQAEFVKWMTDNGHADATARGYASSVRRAERYASEHSFLYSTVMTDDSDLCQKAVDCLLQNDEFLMYDKEQHYRFSAAMKKYLLFLQQSSNIRNLIDSSDNDSSNEENVEISPELSIQYELILGEYFSDDGYQLGRAIVRARFKRYYEDVFECSVSVPDKILDEAISKIGDVRDGRVYPRQGDGQYELIDQIISEMTALFDNGVSAIYTEAIFEHYRQELAESLQIYHYDALNDLLLKRTAGKFQWHRKTYFALNGNTANTEVDLQRIVSSFHSPVSREEIHVKAWFIPYDKMKYMLSLNKAMINMGEGTYLYAPNLPVSTDELNKLIQLISAELTYRTYITDVELQKLIEQNLPGFVINTEGLYVKGIRNCLGYLLREHFSFNGPIITKAGKELRMTDVFSEFAKYHERLDLSELETFAAEMNIPIYWDSVLGEMVRVSEELLVRKDFIHFDTEAIDAVLETMCTGDYVPLKEIELFLSFPNVGYMWNHYLLESYLYQASCRFRLLHVSFSKKGVYGAMVRADSQYQEYRDLVVDILSEANALQSSANALQYLVDQGYQARRRLDDIEQIVKSAKLLKEQKENNKK